MVTAPSGIKRIISKTAGKIRLKANSKEKVVTAPIKIITNGLFCSFFDLIILLIRNIKLNIIRVNTVTTKRIIPFSTTGSGLLLDNAIPEKTRFPKRAPDETTTMYGNNKYLYHQGKVTFS